MVVTADLTLTRNLTGCPGDGLLVMSSGVTVDLNGHSIRGSGNGSGVAIGPGALSVTIKNGAVERFATGVQIDIGAEPGTATSPTLTGLVIDHNSTGISSLFDGFLTIQNSSIVENGGDGVSMVHSVRTTVSNNVIALNGGAGLSAQPESDNSSYTGNTIVGNDGPGITLSSSVSRLTNNVVTDNGGGGVIALENEAPSLADAYVFAGNNVSRNGGLGISACVTFPDQEDPCSAGMTDGGGNVAVENVDSRQCLNISCGTPNDCATATLRAGFKTFPRTSVDNNRAGRAEAFQAQASATGTASTTCIFVDRSNSARRLIAGLYSDVDGRPGSLLAQGITLKVTDGAFNAVWMPSVPLTAGATYWIAVLSPQGAGTLRVREHCCGQAFGVSAPSEESEESGLAALAPAWTSGERRPRGGPLLGWTGG
jgi:parallel beta-helix repeat protein